MQRNKISLDEILLFFLLLFGPLAHGLVETWSITTALLTVISLISIAVLTRIHKGELRFYRTPTDIPIFFFLISILISYCISVYPYASRIIIYKGLAGLALFFYIVNTQRSQQKINLLLWVIVILGAMYAVMGLTLIDGDILGFKIYSQKRYNISLFYVNYNHFAGYLELVFCLSVGLAAASKGGKRILLFGMTVLIAAAALFTLSRGGIIGLTGGLAFFIIASAFMRRQKKGLLLLLSVVFIGIIIIAWFGLNPVLERLNTLDDLSVAGEVRMQVWRDTFRMIYDRPFFGWGPDTFSVAFPAYQTQGFDQKFVNYAHNDYLELAADTGILGLTAFICGLLSLYFFCLKNLKKATYNRYWQNIGIGALAACFSILIHSVTDCNLHVPANLFLFAAAAGIAAVAASKRRQKKKGACINIKLKSPIRKNIAFMNCVLFFCASATIILLPFFGERTFNAAKTSLHQEKYDDAILKIDRALLLNPDNSVFLCLKADILLVKKIQIDMLPDIKNCTECDKIEKWYRKACGASPTNSSYLIKKAAFFERYKMTPAARKAYAKAIRLSPMYAPTYYHMAVLSLRQRQLDDALKYFNFFLKLSGEKELNKVIDDIWSAGGDYETQKRAVPETASFRQVFARYLATDGENELAAQEAVFAFSLEPTVRNALMHLNLLWGNKDFESSLTASEEYLKQFPGELQIKERYAATLEKLKRYQEAVSVYSLLIDEYSETKKCEKYFVIIARLYTKKKLYCEAVAVLEQGIKKYPRTGGLYHSMGIYLRAMKKNEEALEALKKAVSLNPDNVSFRYQLGEEYRRNRLEQEALKEWKECLAIKSNFPPCKKGIETIQKQFNFSPVNGPTKNSLLQEDRS